MARASKSPSEVKATSVPIRKETSNKQRPDTKKQQKAQTATSLVQKLDIESETPAGAEKTISRSEEQAVMKIVEENFLGYSCEEVSVYEQGGQTYFERINADRAKGDTIVNVYNNDRRSEYHHPNGIYRAIHRIIK